MTAVLVPMRRIGSEKWGDATNHFICRKENHPLIETGSYHAQYRHLVAN
ncbi:MAG: hypothetical protein K1X61_00135 [Chitinophagales bacterium]|nr:hypothetical protein [Chitinophagales bacterium]